MEGVLASALRERPAVGAGGARDRIRSGVHGNAVPDAEAMEPTPLCEPQRCLLRLVLHGFVRLCSAAAGKSREAAVETRTSAVLHGAWCDSGHLNFVTEL